MELIKRVVATSRSWQGYLIPLFSALLSTGVASVKLSSPALWTDELATWSAATRSLSELRTLVEHRDITHVAYYLFMHAWVSVFGTSEIALRAPSALAVGVAAAFTVMIVQRMTGAWHTALATGVLFSVVPAVTRYGQEARVYAIVLALTAAATWAVLRARERPTLRRWTVYVLLILALGWAHFIALLILVAHAVAVWPRRGRVRIQWGVSTAIAVLGVAPVLWGAVQQQGVNSWLEDPSWPHTITVWNEVFGTAVVAGAMLLFAVVGVITASRSAPQDAWWVGVWALSGPVLLFCAGQISASLWNPRYVLYTLPAFIILAGYALYVLAPPPHSWPALLLIGVIAFLGVPEQQALRRSDAHARMDGEATVALLAKHAEPGDGVAYAIGTDVWASYDTMEYYAPRMLPEEKIPHPIFITRTPAEAGTFEPPQCEGVVECTHAAAGVQRIWVVRWGAYPRKPLRDFGNEAVSTLLTENFALTAVHLPSPEMTLALYTRNAYALLFRNIAHSPGKAREEIPDYALYSGRRGWMVGASHSSTLSGYDAIMTSHSRVSKRLSAIAPSATLAVDAAAKQLAAEGKPVLRFGVGEPDFPTPEYIVKAAADAASDPATHRYSATGGLPQLKQAIVDAVARDSRVTITPDQVLVTNGGKQAGFQAFAAILDPSDEVILPAPYWTSYPEMIALTGAEAVPVLADDTQNYRVTVEQLEEAYTPRTKALVLCSPSNPTGSVYTPEELREIGEWAVSRGVWIVTDEIYQHLVYNGDDVAPSILSVVPEVADTCIVLNGVAKTFAMTGWRVGWLYGPKDVVKAATSFQSHLTSNVANVSQRAAIAALTTDLSTVHQMRAAFDKRRHTMMEMLNEIPGFETPEPQGAFYCFPSVKGLIGQQVHGERITSSAHLAEMLLKHTYVAAVPGEAFGAPGFMRFSYALSDDDLVEGLTRVREFVGA